MRLHLAMRFCVAIALIGAIAASTTSVFAHEQRDVGNYHFVVGWIVEPSFEGEKNGVDLRITHTSDKSAVTGADQTLKVDITYTPSNTAKTFAIRGIFNDAGHYTADIVPVLTGQYSFHFKGTLEGNAIDQTFTSGDKFGNIEPISDIQFPQVVPQVRELQGVVQSAAAQGQSASDDASSAKTIGVIGIVIGALGLVAAGGALVTARKK
ncbi:MAG: hypothetical protein HY261_06655 [Chloroflexi bacterium]|nr:hypothetical protein [Chloroflexota bacterium]